MKRSNASPQLDPTARRSDQVKASLAEIASECNLTQEELQRLQDACEIIVVDDRQPRHIRGQADMEPLKRERNEEEYQDNLGGELQLNT